MCGIFGSFNRDKFFELEELNAYRGSISSSLAHIAPDGRLIELRRSLLPIDPSRVMEENYKLGHLQAPTTAAQAIESIHPAQLPGSETKLLWHNGIVKNFDVDRIQLLLGTTEKWDTMLILQLLQDPETWLKELSKINGSFSCVYFEEGTLFLFRNQISPLFIDSDLNISSVKFPGSESLVPDTVHMVDLESKTLTEVGSFSTLENPYYWEE